MTQQKPSPYRYRTTLRTGKPVQVSGLVEGVVAGGLAKRGFKGAAMNIILKWGEIVPAIYAPHCRPFKLYGGTLTIMTVSASAGMNMSYQGPALVARINQFVGYGAVRELKFINLGHRTERRGQEVIWQTLATEGDGVKLTPTAEATQQAEQACAHVKDDDLRESLSRLGALIKTPAAVKK